MKILHINTLDRGGAANACLRLHEALLKKGVDSNVLVLNPTKERPRVSTFNYWHGAKSKIDVLSRGIKMMLYDRKIRHRAASLPPYPGMFSFPETIFDITQSPLYIEADIIQLNWVSGFLDESSFFRKNQKPIVWRMADLYVTGGGTHYEKGFPFDAFSSYINSNTEIRKKYMNSPDLDLNIVPISNWTKEKAEASELTKRFNKRIIHCGVDTDTFYPIDKELARRVLNLPLEKKTILYGADSLTDPRKGAQLLINALNQTDLANIQLVCFGKAPVQLENSTVSLGIINDERLLTMLYSAVDLFVTPAVEEAFGQTSIEALACGTPLVAFPTGGGIDILKNNPHLGVLAEDFTETDLQKAIHEAINTEYERTAIRKHIKAFFDINQKADEYISLYKSILKK